MSMLAINAIGAGLGAVSGYMRYQNRIGEANKAEKISNDYQNENVDNVESSFSYEHNEIQRERFDRIEFDTNADEPLIDEEPQDFRAIRLIKESKIELPDPQELIERRVENIVISDDDNYAINALTSNVETENVIESGIRRASEIGEANEADFAAQENLETDTAETEITVNYTTDSSAEIEEKNAGQRFTPAQQKGMEMYQRVQNYSNAFSMSAARMAG